MNTELKDYSISRTGLPPIRFKGEELVNVDSRNNYSNSRWHVLTLYQTKGGKYVIERNYRTCWQGERDHDEAVSFNNAPEVIKWLENEEGSWGSLSQELIEEAAKIIPAFNKEWAVEVE